MNKTSLKITLFVVYFFGIFLFLLFWVPSRFWEWWHFGPSQKILRFFRFVCPSWKEVVRAIKYNGSN
jgi:hypothetical protein